MFRMLLLICLLLVPQQVKADSFDHSGWTRLLKAHVRMLQNGQVSQVDYQGMLSDKEELDRYLHSLSAVERRQFDGWPADEQLAFLINAYNSWTVALILTKYPDLKSIKELGSFFQSPWKKTFIPLLGEERSLDDIEHSLIRGSGRFNDPRIHFAVNCASVGCPALRDRAYLAAKLQDQLAEATSLFLMDRSRNRLEGRLLKVSSIFKWYRGDFEKGWLSIHSLQQFFAGHAADLGLTEEEGKELLAGKIGIDFLDYDWSLNAVK